MQVIWGVWCVPPKGIKQRAGWMKDGRRCIFKTKKAAEAAARRTQSDFGYAFDWKYEARKIK